MDLWNLNFDSGSMNDPPKRLIKLAVITLRIFIATIYMFFTCQSTFKLILVRWWQRCTMPKEMCFFPSREWQRRGKKNSPAYFRLTHCHMFTVVWEWRPLLVLRCVLKSACKMTRVFQIGTFNLEILGKDGNIEYGNIDYRKR